MRTSSAVRSTRVLLAAVTAVGLAIAGCGSDKNATTTNPATTAVIETSAVAAAPTTPGVPASAAPATPDQSAPGTSGSATSDGGSAPAKAGASNEYCAAEMDVNSVASAAGDPQTDPVAFAKALLPSAQAAAALAPASIAPTFTSALAALQAASGGDASQMDGVGQLSDQINEFDVANCPWTKVPVSMEDYQFKGIPATVPAGDYVFQMSNTGAEQHVMLVIRKKPGVTKSFDELLDDPNGESQVDTVVANGAAPGGSALAIGHLDPGEYLVICPVSVGSTDPQTEGTGPPHFTVGMREQLTVT